MAELGICAPRARRFLASVGVFPWLSAVLVVLALTDAPASANTYYVATTGNNNNNGSSGSPWQTLAKAAGVVAPGDTVIVQPGNYAGFNITTSGTAANRITFSAQPGAVINSPGPSSDGIGVNFASYVTIEGFTLIGTGNVNTSRAGIAILGDGDNNPNAFNTGCIIRNNTVDQWGKWGIFSGFAQNLTIENNITSHSAQQHGIYVSNSADNPIIRGNWSHDNAGSGIQINADINTGNTKLPGVDGIISNALVERNIINNNGTPGGGSGLNMDGVQSSKFYNNLLYNNHASGISLFDIDGAAGSMNNVLANNTFINASGSRDTVNITDGATGTTMFNNIFFDLGSNPAVSIASDSLSGTKSDYNLVQSRLNAGGSNLTLAQWQTQTGLDAHSQTLTLAQLQALFTNYASNDYTLAASSLALNVGINGLFNGATFVAPPGQDLLGNPRPIGSGFDIGAYERVPEPATLAMLGLMGLALAWRPRRQNR